jgi:uncharacterized protein YecE (DUF72 family)
VFSVITSAMVATRASLTGAYVGTSGFSYPPWRGGFYPEKSKPSEFLEFFSARLPSVELNTTFYQLPSEEQLRRWAAQTPPEFRFAVKMNRRILVQFPPTRARDEGLLRLVLDSLDPELEYAFEFRHESWAGVDVPVLVNSFDAEAPFRYFRLREPPYDDAELRGWAGRFRPLLDDGTRIYCYFKHEDEPTAPLFAQRLLELLG